MGRLNTGLMAASAMLIVGLAGASGPDWLESPDADRLPPGAQIPGPPGAPLGSIMGNLGAPLPLEGVLIDFEDMYLICITDPENFVAWTESPGGDILEDFQLWLFAFDEFGLLANDDDPGLQPEALIQSPANDGTGQTIPAPGLYYIAITTKPNQALSVGGPIFNFISPTEISGPDGPGGGNQIWDWIGGGPFIEVDYVIRFQPDTACMPITCLGDCNFDGTVDVADLLEMLANYGKGDGCDIAPKDSPDGVVDIQDLLLLLSNWGPCDGTGN